jgi:hypothetical protein
MVSWPTVATGQCLPDGDYASDPQLQYTCAFGIETWSVTTWRFTTVGDDLHVDGLPGPLPTMVGTRSCGDSSFAVTGFEGGACEETFTLGGQIDGPGHWTGTFVATYIGTCYDCTQQILAVAGTMDVTAVAEPDVRGWSWGRVKCVYQ